MVEFLVAPFEPSSAQMKAGLDRKDGRLAHTGR
jgi:hypothetical protein